MINRRDFLKAGGGAALSAGVTLRVFGNDERRTRPVTNEKRWGMLVDTDKCANGCDACVSACQDEHGWGLEEHSSDAQKTEWIKQITVRDRATGKISNLPLMCQHCEKPPCVDVCPTNASMRRADGVVLVDKHRCIGCRYCMMACPYDARSFVHETLENQKAHSPRGKGTVESCNFCVHRIDQGEQPACVTACAAENHHALLFGDLFDPTSEINQALKKYQSTQIRSDLNLNTGVRYRGI